MAVHSGIRTVDDRVWIRLNQGSHTFWGNERGFNVCPRCRGPVFPIRRSLADKVVGLIGSVHRYRCESMDCDWEGHLPA
jgi:hypothetical protein